MDTISSPHNPLVKQVKLLKQKKHRDGLGLFFIEGSRFVQEAVLSAAGIEYIFVTESFAASNKVLMKQLEAYRTYLLPEKLLAELSDTESPQGILAVVKAAYCSLETLLAGKGMLIVLDSLQDPGNMGTIIRTADAADFAGIILSKGCVDVYNPKVLRSTMGSIFHIPFYQSHNLLEALAAIKAEGIKLYAADMKGASSLYEMDLRGRTAFIIGNEANGISDGAASYADELLRIPMPGRAESLNAAVAAALLMYESVRQRMGS